jgi:DNA-binding FrmR family transcriptional regulator
LFHVWCQASAKSGNGGIADGTAHIISVCGLESAADLDISRAAAYHTPYPILRRCQPLSHTKSEKLKLLNRVKRVRGQIEAIERALKEQKSCADVLHLIVAARGALSGLMSEVIEDHIRLHVVDPARDSERSRGAEELIEAVQAYLK